MSTAAGWLRWGFLIAILVAVMGISRYAYWRIDLTEHNLYTLSGSTKTILKRLEAPLHVKVYFSQNMPIAFSPVVRYLNDLFSEYEQAGQGLLKVEYIDPTGNEDLERQAYALGLQKVKANVTESGRMELAEVWFGFALIYQDQTEVFPSVGDLQNFEYDMTSAIARMVNPSRPNVKFVGPGLSTLSGQSSLGHSMDKDMAELAKSLGESFDLSHHDTAQDPNFVLQPADLVILWGVHTLQDDQVYTIDQFMMSGKPIIFLAPGVSVDPLRLIASEIPPSRFDDFLEHLGLRVERNLVADSQAQVIRQTIDNRPVVIQYPLFPLISPESQGFDADYGPTQSMNSLLVPWPSQIQLTESAKQNPNFIRVAKSSDQSWLLEKSFVLDPERVPGPHAFESYLLGVAYSGSLTSFFSDTSKKEATDYITQSNKSSFLLISTEHILGHFQNPSTTAFLNNVVTHMLGDHELADIPRRETSFRPLKDVNENERNQLKWLSVIIGPSLVLVWALCRAWLRKRRKLSRYIENET